MAIPSLRVPVALALGGKGARAMLRRRRTPSAPEDRMRMMPAAATVGTDLKAGVCCFLRESIAGELQGREHANKVLHLYAVGGRGVSTMRVRMTAEARQDPC